MPNDPEDFNKINGINNPENKDDIIDSSFGVRFKPGDKTESIADKLKETKENIEKKTTETASAGTSRFDPSSTDGFKDSFKDEFDNFEFDSSISAFKPFNAPQQTEAPKSAPIPEALKSKPASNEPVFPKDGGTFDKPAFTAKAPEPPKEALPKFNEIDSKPDSAKPANDKFFNSGNGLDFATSEHDKKTSPFANAEKPEQPKAANIDIPGTDKPAAPAAAPAKPVNPFASSAPAPEAKPAQKAPEAPKGQPAGYRPHPSASMTNLFTTPTQATMNAEKAFAEFLDDDFKPSTQAPISPFKSVAQKASAAPAPSAPAPAPAKPVEPAKPAAPVAPAKPVESVKPEAPVAPAKPVEPARPAAPVAPAKPVEPARPAAPVAPAKPVESARPAAPVAPAKPVESARPAAPVTPAKPVEPAKAAAVTGAAVTAATAAAATAPKAADSVKAPAETAQPQRPAASAPKAETHATKAEAAAPQAPAQRPGASNSKPAPAPGPQTAQNAPYSPFEAKGKQPVAATRGVSHASHQDKTISPVTTVKKSKKKVKEPKSAKDPGLAGLITFLVIIVLAIGILWVLDNTSGIRAFFGKKTIETIPTVSTEATTEKSVETTTEATTTVTEATTTTTEATTEATTTTTEATTTTTEATTTTTEATTTTTEVTTTTTEATTVAVDTAETAEGSCVTAINTKLTKFKTMDKGFKFTMELTNTSNTTCSLPKSLNYLDMKFFCNSTITEVSSECFTFSAKKDGVSFRGTPKEVTIKPRATYSFTVYVYTKENVSSYGYKTAYFDWKK